MNTLAKLCTPAKIYFTIAIIATVVALFNGAPLIAAFVKITFALIWTYILGFLCKKGYSTISWALVLLPYVIIVFAMLNMMHITNAFRQIMRTVKLQGMYGQEAMSSPFATLR